MIWELVTNGPWEIRDFGSSQILDGEMKRGKSIRERESPGSSSSLISWRLL